MFLCRLPSFHELETHRGRGVWRRYLGHRLPSADECAYVAERLELDSLRALQGHLYHRLLRNKVLAPLGGWRLAVLDGHELPASYHRCCAHCLRRTIGVGGRERTQFYHRLVACELVGPRFRLLLDAELVAPGEDEVAAGLRLLKRVLAAWPRCFDILSADAIYLRASVLRLLQAHGKYLVATLKENNRDLLRDAGALFARETPQVEEVKDRRLERWDLEGFTTDWYEQPLRVIRSREERVRRTRLEGAWQRESITADWWWATNLPRALASSATVAAHYGHGRWQIENEGFNELVNHWHADHYFHHHPVAILALWLILFAAHAVFHCFWLGNLKPALREAHSRIHLARELAADLVRAHWWPVPT